MSETTAQMGWEVGGPPAHLDERTDRDRWADAAPKLAMALCEAGYPTQFDRISFLTGRENELSFNGPFPPDAVLLKAGRLAGIEDLIQRFIIEGRQVGWGEPSQ